MNDRNGISRRRKSIMVIDKKGKAKEVSKKSDGKEVSNSSYSIVEDKMCSADFDDKPRTCKSGKCVNKKDGGKSKDVGERCSKDNEVASEKNESVGKSMVEKDSSINKDKSLNDDKSKEKESSINKDKSLNDDKKAKEKDSSINKDKTLNDDKSKEKDRSIINKDKSLNEEKDKSFNKEKNEEKDKEKVKDMKKEMNEQTSDTKQDTNKPDKHETKKKETVSPIVLGKSKSQEDKEKHVTIDESKNVEHDVSKDPNKSIPLPEEEKKTGRAHSPPPFRPAVLTSPQLPPNSHVRDHRKEKEVVCEGWIWKRRRIFACFWHSKYFVLTKDGMLRYYKADGTREAKGNWDTKNLNRVHMIYISDEAHPYRVAFITGDESLLLGFDDPETREYWYERLSRFVKN